MSLLRWCCLVGALAIFGVVGTGSAGATPEQLPSEAKVRTFTGKLVGGILFAVLGGLKVECTKAPGEGTEEEKGKPLGLYHIKFEGCEGTVGGVKAACTGLGDPGGTILALGKWHLWYDSLTTLGVATIFLLEPVHITCAGGVALVVVRGNHICLDLEPTVKKFTHVFHCEQENGDPKETKYWNEAGTEEIAKMESSINGGAFESAAELTLVEVTSTVETFADKV